MTDKKQILHITFDMRIGGTEMVIRNLIEGADATLLDMSIFCIEEPLGPWGVDLQKSGLKIVSKARQAGFDTSLIFAIRKYIKDHKIDIVHCHQYTPWVYGVLAAFGTKTKVIFTEHGRFYPDSSSWKRKWINPWLCRVTDHITSISKATKQALVEFENIPEHRIQVVYNGILPPIVDPFKTSQLRRELKIAEHTLILGTIARLDPIKNHTMMLEAFSLVLKVYPDTVLIIVGDGEERQNIEEQIQTLDIKNKVILPGYDPQPQHYLALMDIFLLSSLSEGASMTLLEAMALKKPCVVTDAGGNSEIIQHNINGIVTPNNIPKDFAEGIMLLQNNSFKRAEFGEKSKVIFDDKFTVEAMSTSFEHIYKS
jgi:glycosyltransferase involved in cell wall biosynthesis